MTAKRLFVGIMVDTKVQRELLALQNNWTWPASARLTKAENFHLTLQFLGQVEAGPEAHLAEQLGLIQVEPFDLLLARTGSFGGGIAWVAPERSEALTNLHKQVAFAVRQAGLEANEDWAPHVTLARRAEAGRPPDSFGPICWAVRGFSLVVSDGGVYRELRTWPARKAESQP